MFMSRTTTALALALATALPNAQLQVSAKQDLVCEDQEFLGSYFSYCANKLVTIPNTDQGNVTFVSPSPVQFTYTGENLIRSAYNDVARFLWKCGNYREPEERKFRFNSGRDK
eukprot:Pgem_evm1s6379